MDIERLHVIDGTYELFRAHFAKRPGHVSPDGRDLKATLGVVWSILSLLGDSEERVTHLAVAFDNPIRSFRNDLYEGYKTDEGVPDELRRQFDAVEDGMRAIGVVVWSMDRWEADDALATAAARWSDQVGQVRIMTPDKDLGQCLCGDRVVQVDRMRKRTISEAAFMTQRGISPSSLPDYLALVGDAADGIPGVAGFGEKTASRILGVYPHLEVIPARASDWAVEVRGAAGLAAELQAHRDDARLYRRLATLECAVPLRESLADLSWAGIPRPQFDTWCAEVGASERLREYADGLARERRAPH